MDGEGREEKEESDRGRERKGRRAREKMCI